MVAPDRRLLSRARRELPVIARRLRRTYGRVPVGHAPLGNKRNPLDELVYIQLSVRTREGTYQSVYRNLRRIVRGAWRRLPDVPETQVLTVLETGGMGALKLDRLRRTFHLLEERFGKVTLAPLRSISDEQVEATLRALPGIGPKVARCIMLYSLDREVFPVDSNCERVLRRIGLIPSSVDIKAAHDFAQALVPRAYRRELHVNLVHHGRAVCVPVRPRCGICPIQSCCDTGRARVGVSSARRAREALINGC